MNQLDHLPVEVPQDIKAPAAARLTEAGSNFSPTEITLTWVILGFGLIAILVFFLLVRRETFTPFAMRMYVVLILIFGTLLVVSSAYTTDQIAPVVGFFGTIAGYLLGRSDRPSNDQHHD